jgi:hypothetical protein
VSAPDGGAEPVRQGAAVNPAGSDHHGTPLTGGPTMAGARLVDHAPQGTTRTRAGGRRGVGGEAKMVPAAKPSSYYGRPILKPPEWTPEIAWYLFAGGLAGGSAPLAYLAGRAGHRELARAAWLASFAGITASPPLLIKDLGRPERFLNMLRVFKVTSPMSVGSWILAGSGAAISAATFHELTGRLPRLARPARPAAAALGSGLCTYTAALVANTAVPVWHEARRELPFVFAGSSLASAGAAAAILTPVAGAAPARRLVVGGVLLETAAVRAMERRLGDLGAPYRSGRPQRYAQAAKALGAAGGLLTGYGGRRRRSLAAAGGALTLAGAIAQRFAVFSVGRPSATDPRYVVEPQRARRAGAK